MGSTSPLSVKTRDEKAPSRIVEIASKVSCEARLTSSSRILTSARTDWYVTHHSPETNAFTKGPSTNEKTSFDFILT